MTKSKLIAVTVAVSCIAIVILAVIPYAIVRLPMPLSLILWVIYGVAALYYVWNLFKSVGYIRRMK